jgi:predicted phosphodiesterase
MPAIRRDWSGVGRGDTFRIVPLADVHIGSAACNEKLLRSVVQRIKDDDRCYWIGLGDYCEFVNRSDKRFSTSALADWLRVEHLGDIARAQRDRFLDIIKPIADRCLAIVGGNHEWAIKQHYERDILYEIVSEIKKAAGHPADYRLCFDSCGWLVLTFRREAGRTRRTLRIYLHHGFVGGKLAGAKALNMQRWLWTHDADLVLFGHSHNTGIQVEAVESVTTAGKILFQHRIGAYAGTFLRGAEYAQRKGYFPLPLAHVEVVLRPGAVEYRDRIKVLASI